MLLVVEVREGRREGGKRERGVGERERKRWERGRERRGREVERVSGSCNQIDTIDNASYLILAWVLMLLAVGVGKREEREKGR